MMIHVPTRWPWGVWDGDLARDQGAVWCMWLAQWGAVRCSRGVRCSAGGGTCRQGLNVHGAGLRAVLRGCAGGGAVGDGATGAGRSTPEAFQAKGGLEFDVTHQVIHLGPSCRFVAGRLWLAAATAVGGSGGSELEGDVVEINAK